MKISELVEYLEDVRAREGDLRVVWDSLSHCFEVDPRVRGEKKNKQVVVNG